mgnify:CR=1 FL=1
MYLLLPVQPKSYHQSPAHQKHKWNSVFPGNYVEEHHDGILGKKKVASKTLTVNYNDASVACLVTYKIQ